MKIWSGTILSLVFVVLSSCIPQQQQEPITPDTGNDPFANSTNNGIDSGSYSTKCTLTANPATSQPNRPVNLSLSAGTEFVSASIDNKPVQLPNGSIMVAPTATTEYIAIVRDKTDQVHRCSTTVSIAGY